MNDPAAAVAHLEAGPLHDPIAVIELDELYASLGRHERRATLLQKAAWHPRIVERRADLALTSGKPAETIRLLSETEWQHEHQRCVLTELWRKARVALGERVIDSDQGGHASPVA